MGEEEAKADYARHNKEVLAYVQANKVMREKNAFAKVALLSSVDDFVADSQSGSRRSLFTLLKQRP